jgi:hypothetical protein
LTSSLMNSGTMIAVNMYKPGLPVDDLFQGDSLRR